MRRKIEWYQEVLALEPGSRIFFPLAKLFVEFGQLDDAEKTLRQGLDRHPDSMEARLLLIQVLMRLEKLEQAQEQLQAVVKPLERYPAFWSLWAHQTSDKDRDFAVFLMLVASHFTDRPVKWTDVVIEGLGPLTDRLIGPLKDSARKAREQSQARSALQQAAGTASACDARSSDASDAPYSGPAPDAGSFRTRTMAELLASQGDFGGALGIYRELWGLALDEREKADLTSRIKTLEANLAAAPSVEAGPQVAPGEDPFGKHAKNRLMSTLEALAARLESRIQA